MIVTINNQKYNIRHFTVEVDGKRFRFGELAGGEIAINKHDETGSARLIMQPYVTNEISIK